MKAIMPALVGCFCALSAHAAIIDIPSAFPTIQAGLNAAATSDTVRVAAGTYTGDGNRDIFFGGKAVLLWAPAGPQSTIIDCGGETAGNHAGFYLWGKEDSLTIIDGFTITNAVYTGNPQFGAGIHCDSSSPMIRNCVIEGNSGHGIWSHIRAHPVVRNCVIRGNGSHGVRVGDNPGAIGSSITLERCLIEANDSIGIIIQFEGNHIIRNCTVVSNGEDGIFYRADLPKPVGGQVYVQSIENCLVWGNQRYGIASDNIGYPQIVATCCDFYGNDRGNFYGYGPEDTVKCFSADPHFCGPADDPGQPMDYHLNSSSPCLPGNNVCKVLIGAFDQGCSCCVNVGDLNLDRLINGLDLAVLIAYLTPPAGPMLSCPVTADLNADGRINSLDIAWLIAYLVPPPGPTLPPCLSAFY